MIKMLLAMINTFTFSLWWVRKRKKDSHSGTEWYALDGHDYRIGTETSRIIAKITRNIFSKTGAERAFMSRASDKIWHPPHCGPRSPKITIVWCLSLLRSDGLFHPINAIWLMQPLMIARIFGHFGPPALFVLIPAEQDMAENRFFRAVAMICAVEGSLVIKFGTFFQQCCPNLHKQTIWKAKVLN